MKKRILITSLIFILISINSYSQEFGDSYYSVKSSVKNITSSVEGIAITCKLDLYDYESYIIFNFDEDARLYSYMVMHYVTDKEGSDLYSGYYKKYSNDFGTPLINNERKVCSDCPKIKSKWAKGSETLTINYFSLNGEALIQVMTMRRKGTY